MTEKTNDLNSIIQLQDIEYCVEQGLDSLLRPGCSGSFALDLNGEETVAYVAELRNSTKDQEVLREAADSVRRLVAENFQVRETYRTKAKSAFSHGHQPPPV